MMAVIIACISTSSFVIGVICCYFVLRNHCLNKMDHERNLCEKFREFYHTLARWVRIKQREESVGQYLLDKGIHSVAIYGMKELGNLLYDELKKSGVEVRYAIDKDAEYIFSELSIVRPDENLFEVDAILVTAIHYYDEIEMYLKKKVPYKVICIEDVLYEM